MNTNELKRRIQHHERMADLETRLARLEETLSRQLEAIRKANRHAKKATELTAELNGWASVA
jgi:predicted  nucleic acid-binding Zn-ribbon protein